MRQNGESPAVRSMVGMNGGGLQYYASRRTKTERYQAQHAPNKCTHCLFSALPALTLHTITAQRPGHDRHASLHKGPDQHAAGSGDSLGDHREALHPR